MLPVPRVRILSTFERNISSIRSANASASHSPAARPGPVTGTVALVEAAGGATPSQPVDCHIPRTRRCHVAMSRGRQANTSNIGVAYPRGDRVVPGVWSPGVGFGNRVLFALAWSVTGYGLEVPDGNPGLVEWRLGF